MQIIGHRGAAGLIAENTLPSIQKALDLGVDWIEFDVHATRDGQLVVIHDKHTRRIADERLRVKHSDYLTLQKLETISGIRIPTFGEVVQLVGGRAKINVELKSKGCAAEVAATIKRLVNADYGYDHFMVSSFSPTILKEVQKRDKRIRLGLLHRHVPLAFMAHRDLKLWAAGFQKLVVTPQVIKMAKKQGLFTYIHTVNKVEAARKFDKWGVDGIVTNFPDRMVREFHEPITL